MRGCLSFVLFAVLLIGLLAWFVLPAIAGPLVVAGFAAAGLRGTDTQATVTADPPLELLALHADRVRIRSSDVTLQDLHATSLDVTIADVGLLDRTFATIDGTLEGVSATTAEGSTVDVPSVRVTGTASVTNASFLLPTSLVADLAASAADRATGRQPDSVRLVAPDVVEFAVAGTTLDGTIAVDPSGDLIVEPSGPDARLPALILVTAASVEPLALESVRVVDAGVQVEARVDLAAIGL